MLTCEDNARGVTIARAFSELLGSAPEFGDVCIILDDAVPQLVDRQVAIEGTSYYIVERSDWPAVRARLEDAAGSSADSWCRILDFDPRGEYGDLFDRIAEAASKRAFQRM